MIKGSLLDSLIEMDEWNRIRIPDPVWMRIMIMQMLP